MDITIDSHSVYLNTGGVAWQDGRPWLCLIHGASLDHTVWVLYSRYFARQGYNVVTPDLPGHGRSEGAVPDSIEAMAEWVAALLEKVASGSPIHLAGHSMGSLVALQTASMQKNDIQRLLLLGSAVPMPVGDALLNAARDNDHASIDMVSIFGHSLQSRLGGNPVAGINVLGAAIKLMEQAGPGVMFGGLNACNNYTAGLEQASKVKAATTLILGEQDMMTPPSGAKAVAKALKAETILLPKCGHMMLAERPEATLQAMLKGLA